MNDQRRREHQHNYVVYTNDDISEMMCECGVILRSIYNGAVVVEDQDGRGTE